MSKDEILEIIVRWQVYWMNEKDENGELTNVARRATGVNANMKHHLAKMIAKAFENKQEGAE